MKPYDLEAYIDKHLIPAVLVRPPTPVPTVLAAAQALGVSTDSIIKSVLFMIRRSAPLLVIANGERRINQGVIAHTLGVGKKQVRIASPNQVEDLTGYPVGGVPPFGHREPLPTWMDPAVMDQEMIYGGGGDDMVLIRIRAADLLLATNADVIPVCD